MKTNMAIDTDVLSAGFRPPTVRRSFLRSTLRTLNANRMSNSIDCKAVRPCLRVKALQRLAHDVQKQGPICVVLGDRLTPVTPRCHVVHRTSVFNA